MRVTAVGLCGSDLHWYEDGGIGFDKVVSPLVLGHEMGGVIAAGPREGMRVVIEPANPCGHCAACRAGDANLCPSVKFCGHAPIDGSPAHLHGLAAAPAAVRPGQHRGRRRGRSWSRSASPSTPSTSVTSGRA